MVNLPNKTFLGKTLLSCPPEGFVLSDEMKVIVNIGEEGCEQYLEVTLADLKAYFTA